MMNFIKYLKTKLRKLNQNFNLFYRDCYIHTNSSTALLKVFMCIDAHIKD